MDLELLTVEQFVVENEPRMTHQIIWKIKADYTSLLF